MESGLFGVPEAIRTPDLPLRRRLLYPAELRKQERNHFITDLSEKQPFFGKKNEKEASDA